MKAKLLLLEPEASRSEIKLSLPAKIGRGDEAKFKLVHARVSRLHCEIFAQGDQVMVRDFASLNGTFVNDERIIDEAAIPSGGILQVGAAKFQVLYGEDFDRPPSPPAKKAQPGSDAVRKAAAKTSEAAEPDNLDELWGRMDEESAGAAGAAAGGPELLNFLDEEPPPKARPAAKGKPAGKKGAKKEAAEKPADEPASEESAEDKEPAAEDSLADDEELKLAPKQPTAKDKPATASKPKKDSGEGGEEDDEGLDDFLKSIM